MSISISISIRIRISISIRIPILIYYTYDILWSQSPQTHTHYATERVPTSLHASPGNSERQFADEPLVHACDTAPQAGAAVLAIQEVQGPRPRTPQGAQKVLRGEEKKRSHCYTIAFSLY